MSTLAYAARDSRTMLRRNLRRMQRYPAMTMVIIGLPVIFLLLFVYVFGGTIGAAEVGMRLFSVAQRTGYTPMTGGLGQVLVTSPVADPLITVASKDVWVRSAERVTTADSAAHTPPAS